MKSKYDFMSYWNDQLFWAFMSQLWVFIDPYRETLRIFELKVSMSSESPCIPVDLWNTINRHPITTSVLGPQPSKYASNFLGVSWTQHTASGLTRVPSGQLGIPPPTLLTHIHRPTLLSLYRRHITVDSASTDVRLPGCGRIHFFFPGRPLAFSPTVHKWATWLSSPLSLLLCIVLQGNPTISWWTPPPRFLIHYWSMQPCWQ